MVNVASNTANATVPGAMSLLSTFESISVRAKFTGDANSNNRATIQFKKTSETLWHEAYTPIVDRRTSINGTDNSGNSREARGSIVGLLPNTAYDVRVIWSDDDGVTGNATVLGAIGTLSHTPPTNGTTRWIDASVASEGSGAAANPFKTITYAIAQSNSGDTLIVKSGVYAPLTITKSGSANAYFVLKANPGDTVTIQGGTAANNVTLDADYWRLIGFQFAQSVQSSVLIKATRHHIFVEDTVSSNVASGNVWGSGCVSMEGHNNNIYILRNQCYTATPSTDGNIDGIFIQGDDTHTLVIADNTISGSFWDGIGNGANSSANTMENCDFARNTITNWQDDSIELDGGSINLRVWSNRAQSNRAYSAISEAGTIVGPSYIFRNILVNTNPTGTGMKQGHNGVGFSFIFHNVIETAGAGSNEAIGQAGGAPYSENHVFRNNIIKASGNVYYREGRSNSYDYNLLFVTTGAYLVDAWNLTTFYDVLAAFRTGAGQETHGRFGDPRFVSANKDINASSPAYDGGVMLPNFNSLDSAWPYIGNAPDMGAYEAGGVPGALP